MKIYYIFTPFPSIAINSMILILLFGNKLEEKKFLSIHKKLNSIHLLIKIENSCIQSIKKEFGNLILSKKDIFQELN